MHESSFEPIPIICVAGFLGSGKTTLMRRLIAEAHERGLKVALIVNEFGVVDIDSHLLRRADAELVSSISGGCACCSGQEELAYTLLDVGERVGQDRPDVILLETSGLADPVSMLDVMTVANLLPLVRVASLITVIDHARFLLTQDELAPLLIRQLQLADHIIVNKIDVAFRSEDRGTRLASTMIQLGRINRQAVILPARACRVDLDTVWQRVASPPPTSLEEAWQTIPATGAAHAHYQTVACAMPYPIERERLETLLQELPPGVWRVKGFVHLRGQDGLFLLQCTGGRPPLFEIVSFPYSDLENFPSNLVFIGPRLDRAQIMSDFGGHAVLPLA